MKRQNLVRSLSFFFVFSVVEYLLFHLSYVLTDTINGYALFPIRLSLSVFPVTAAAALIKDGLSFGKAAIQSALISITRIPISILYGYMFMMVTTNMRTLEALLWSPLIAIGSAVIYFALILLSYSLTRLVFKLKKASYSGLESFFPISATNLKSPVTLGLLLLPFAIFAFELVAEVISTVSFFISYGSSFRVGEIIFLVFSYLFILLKLVISAYLPVLLSNKLMVNNNESDS